MALIFFFVWCDISINVFGFFSVPLMLLLGFGLLAPIALLIAVVQYKSRIAYSLVIASFLFCILRNLESLPFYYSLLWSEQDSLISEFSICPLCEIQEALMLVIISLMGISLMHNQSMVELYDWNANLFYKTLIATLIFFVLAIVLQIVIN